MDGGRDGQDGWVRDVLGFDLPVVATGVDGPAGGGLEGAGPKGGGPEGGGPEGGGPDGGGADAGAAVGGAVQPGARGTIGPEQSARATKLVAAMSPADQGVVTAVLAQAAPAAKPYLEKALASSHGAAEIKAFAAAIAGKDAAWMDANLHVVGASNGAPGIKQQWRDSCGATTIEAMRAELDPVYALSLRSANPSLATADGQAPTGGTADEQKAILEGHGGKAVARTSAEKTPGQDYGMKLTPALNEATQVAGITCKPEAFKDDSSLGEIDAALKDGLPVPLRLANAKGGHFVLVTGGGGGSYTIHDPWSGKSVTVTGEQIKTHAFDIAGYNTVTHLYAPKATE